MKMKLLMVMLSCTVTASLLAGCGAKETSTLTPEPTAEAEPAATEEAAEQDTAEVTEEVTEETTGSDQEAADMVADLIDAIYVQTWTEDTERQCAEAKAAWDALTDEQKEMVSGEEADPDYFGRDTGDAAADDPLNADEIGEKEILVVSFGTGLCRWTGARRSGHLG